LDEFFVTLRQVDNSFDQAYNATNASTRDDANHQHDDPLLVLAKNEFMDPQPPQKNSEDPSEDLLVCSCWSGLIGGLRGGILFIFTHYPLFLLDICPP
jgi:hypothetical protein